jgi:hypothetical protein
MEMLVQVLTLKVDLPLHKAIESQRQSFDETQVAIARRMLLGQTIPQPSVARESDTSLATSPHRFSRRGGNYSTQLLGTLIEAHSLKDILKRAILEVEKQKPGFIEKLAMHRTSRGRRIVARKPDELYPGKPQLVKDCAERLDEKWWYDTNISNPQCQKYLSVLGQIGGFAEPRLKS